MGITLPVITLVMIGISDFLRNAWYISVPLLIALGWGSFRFFNTKTGRHYMDRSLLQIPVVSSLCIAVGACHFISTLNIAFSAGLPITECIQLSCQTVTNTVMRDIFDEVNLKIQAG